MTPPTNPAPPVTDTAEVIRAWHDIEFSDALTPGQRACVTAATATANTATLAAGTSRVDTDHGPVVPRDGAWYHTALAAYQLLHDTGAYAHRPAAPATCSADPDGIREWLTAESAEPGVTVAEQLDIDEQFGIDDPDINPRLASLFEASEAAGVFGVADHQVELWHVVDNDGALDGHLIVLRSPDDTGLATTHVPANLLVDPDLTGVDAAVSALENGAVYVNELLATNPHPPVAEHRPHATAARAFPALGLAAGPAPVSTSTPQPPPAPGHAPHR